MGKVKVFIFGSCVSRDPFELSEAEGIQVVDYFARSSIASLVFKPSVDHRVLNNIKSNWQRRMVKADMDKTVLKSLAELDYNVLLIDFIDERFHLPIGDECGFTVSTEYKKACRSTSNKIVNRFSDKKFSLWVEGFKKLYEQVVKNKKRPKVLINKVFWTNKVLGGESEVSYSDDQIEVANKYLAKMYDMAADIIPDVQFIDYPSELFFIDSSHKWGVEPYHYNQALNSYMLLKLKAMSGFYKSNSVSSAYGRVFSDFKTAFEVIRDGFFYIRKNNVLFPFQWKVVDVKKSDWVFFSPGRTKRGKPVPVFQRSSYFSELADLNCVSCFDPILFEDESITLGWMIGDENDDYMKYVANLWSEFFDHIKSSKKVLYFGTSGGGMLAVKLAKATRNSIVYVSNIQTNILLYEKSAVESFLKLGFNINSVHDKRTEDFYNRFNIYREYGDYELIYAQNIADTEHTNNHFLPWIRLNELHSYKKTTIIEYDDEVSGHGPLSKRNEICIIDDLINNDGKLLSKYIPNVISKESDAYKSTFSMVSKNFPDYDISLPVDWKVNPFKSKSWCVEYYGLAWLRSVSSNIFLYKSLCSILENVQSNNRALVYKNFESLVVDLQIKSLLSLINKKSNDKSIIGKKIVELSRRIISVLSDLKAEESFCSVHLSSEFLSKNKKIARLVSFLKKEDLLERMNDQLANDGMLVFPSIYAGDVAVCSSSFYFKNRNYLVFKDVSCGFLFLLVQDFTRGFPFLIIDPVCRKVFSNKVNDTRAISLANSVPSNKIVSLKKEFKGYINSYARPYHYFIEKAPFLSFLLKGKKAPFVYTNKKNAFISFSEVFNVNEILVDDDSYDDGFYVDLFRSSSLEKNKSAVESFKIACINASKKKETINKMFDNPELVLWLGVCSEKRAYLEQKQLHLMLLQFLNDRKINYVVVFDGLTSCMGNDVYEFRESYCRNEIDYVQEITDKSNGAVINLIGCSALEKIYFASKTDFFVTNALTDSLWLTWFFDKEGVGYAAKGSKILLPHKNTKIVPESRVVNLNDAATNWSEASFSIDPQYVFDLFADYF